MDINPFIPMRIEHGKRNSTMFFLLSQYALLNPKAGKSFLVSIAGTINRHMVPHLSDNEIKSTAESVVKRREEGNLSLYYNEERRFLFNPTIRLTQKEKMMIVNQESGKLKSELTRELINMTLDDWEFENDGPITQKKVSAKTGRVIATIKRYWNEFKDFVQTLNNDFEQLKSTMPKVQGISIEKYIYNMHCKFTVMEATDERFLKKMFDKKGITHVTDDGFDEVHHYIFEILKSRQALCRVA